MNLRYFVGNEGYDYIVVPVNNEMCIMTNVHGNVPNGIFQHSNYDIDIIEDTMQEIAFSDLPKNLQEDVSAYLDQ